MDERQIAKDALKKEYLKEIAIQLCKAGNLKENAIYVDEEGQIRFPRATTGEANRMTVLVRFLADEIADSKAEMWLRTQSNKELILNFQSEKKQESNSN